MLGVVTRVAVVTCVRVLNLFRGLLPVSWFLSVSGVVTRVLGCYPGRGLLPGSGVVTWVVNAGLDDVVQGESAGRLLVPQVGVHFCREHFGHVVVVLAEVGVLLL